MSQRIQNFGPSQSFTIAATTASSVNQAFAQNAVPNSPLQALRIANAATGPAFVRYGKGSQTATTTGTNDHPVLAGEDLIFDMPAYCDNAAVILASGTGSVYLSIGEGS